VTGAPREISLSFNEAVSVALSRLTLLDAAQRAVKLDSLRHAPGDAKTLTAKVLGALRPGRYSVKWQAGGADGHPMRGEYTFTVD
jgi:methionine-rich copper-binding protein CopC